MNKKLSEPEICLSVRDLSVSALLNNESQSILKNVSFDIKTEQSIAIVGSSGCGKTVTALSLLNLLPENFDCQIGEFIFENLPLENPIPDIDALRGKYISMIFQDPVGALNPVITVGRQLSDIALTHLNLSYTNAKKHSLEYLHEVGFIDPNLIYHTYAHQLSGGMAQRVLIAMALCCQPKLIIADEPTTSLDMITQKNIMDLLCKMQKTLKFSLLLISHDINVVSTIADNIFIMRNGHIIENGSYNHLINQSNNRYTQALLQTLPTQ